MEALVSRLRPPRAERERQWTESLQEIAIRANLSRSEAVICPASQAAVAAQMVPGTVSSPAPSMARICESVRSRARMMVSVEVVVVFMGISMGPRLPRVKMIYMATRR